MNRNLKHLFMYVCLMSMPLVGTASETGSRALADLATGPSFYKGDSEFRLVPGAIAVPSAALRANTTLSRAAIPEKLDKMKDVIQIGDYVIVLPEESKSVKVQARGGAGTNISSRNASYAVAISESSGQPVLVSPSVTVFSPVAMAKELANKTGGKVTYSSELGARTVILYADVDSAINALPTLTENKSVEAILDVIDGFKKPL